MTPSLQSIFRRPGRGSDPCIASRKARHRIVRRTTGCLCGRWLPAGGLHPASDAPEVGDELLVCASAAGCVGAAQNGRRMDGHGHEWRQP